ncbi:hypothetical protein D3C73_1192320 [compost metagenome]
MTPADDKSLDKVLKLIKKEPVELPLDDIDFASIKDRPRDDSRSSRGRGRGERSERSRSRKSLEAAPVEAVEVSEIPAAPETSTPQADEAPRRSRSRKKSEDRAPAAQTVSKPAETVRGSAFGDDVPAFLRRPVVFAD